MVYQYWVEWERANHVFRAQEPNAMELVEHSVQLANDYNEPHNRAMMAHEEFLSPQDVVKLYEDMVAQRGHPFLLYRDGELVGDADLRHIESGRAEFAVMIGSRGAQGKGLGTQLAAMLHVLAFDALELQQVYVTIIPDNSASRRLFEKLGYQSDSSQIARAYTDDPNDICMSVTRPAFEHACQRLAFRRQEIRLGTS